MKDTRGIPIVKRIEVDYQVHMLHHKGAKLGSAIDSHFKHSLSQLIAPM